MLCSLIALDSLVDLVFFLIIEDISMSETEFELLILLDYIRDQPYYF
jgi:hypothetical protein